MNPKILLTIFFLLFADGAIVAATPGSVGFPPIRNFMSKDYFAAPENWACVQHMDGLMYFGNEDGVLEFDGSNWNMIPMKDNRPVRSLAVDSTGKIFVGGVNDFGWIKQSPAGIKVFVSLRSLLPDSLLTFQEVWKTHVIGNTVFFHTDHYIFKYDDHRITIIRVNTLQDYSFSLQGRLLVYQQEIGLSEILDSTVVRVHGGEFYRNKRIRAILPLHHGEMLIAAENGLYVYDGKKSIRFATNADSYFQSARIFDALLLDDSTVVCSTMGGGVFFIDKKGTLIAHVDKNSGILSDLSFALCEDTEGGIWVAQMSGISRIDYRSPLSIIDHRSGFDKFIFSMTRDRKGRLCIGTGDGLYEFDQDKNRFEQKCLSSLDIQGLAPYRDGLLLGCGEGTFYYKNGIAKKISPAYSVSFYPSTFDTNLVFACDYSIRLLELNKGVWIDRGVIPGIQESIFSCYENPDGSLWLFTHFDGVMHVGSQFRNLATGSNTVIERYGIEAGLPSLSYNTPAVVGGKLYFHTIDGLYSFDSAANHFSFDSTVHGQFDPPLPRSSFSISKDVEGTVIVSRQTKQRGTKFILYRRSENGTYKEESSGLGLLNTTGAALLLRDSGGVSWFASENSLFLYDAKKDRHGMDNGVSRIFSIGIQDSLFSPEHSGERQDENIMHIDYSRNNIRFDVSAQSYSGSNEFQYCLDGLDETWSPWTANHSKEYSLLPPGEYRFRVRAMNIRGLVSKEASFSFVVLPPWWKTVWFQIAMVLIFILLIAFILNRLVARRLAAVKAEEAKRMEFSRQLIESQERERKRIAHELHDSISQSLLTIKNRVMMAMERPDQKEWVKTHLDVVLSSSSGAIQEVKQITHNLRPYLLDRIGLTKALHSLLRSFSESSGMSVNERLDDLEGVLQKENEIHFFRILQELLNNIQKHSSATLVDVGISRTDADIGLTVKDNGKGFDVAHLQKQFHGLGLEGIAERVRFLNGVFEIHSKPGEGTIVTITIPFEHYA